MSRIIQLTTFSGDEAAKQLADLGVKRCDSVIYCKTQAEANCYRAMIGHFDGCRNGVDHLYGIIVICVDPSSTMIEGMHLISQRLPSNIKTSYPFQLQAKKIGEERQAEFLESCGLKTEKELKAVWDHCAKRLAFPIEASATEKNDYLSMMTNVHSIIQKKEDDKNKKHIDDIKKAEKAIVYWLNSKQITGKEVHMIGSYSWKKMWRIISHTGYKTYALDIGMSFSETGGINGFSICCNSLDFNFSFPLPQNGIDGAISNFEYAYIQFIGATEAVANAHEKTREKLGIK